MFLYKNNVLLIISGCGLMVSRDSSPCLFGRGCHGRAGVHQLSNIKVTHNVYSIDQYQLNGRCRHRTVSVGDSLYVWAGDQDGLPYVHDREEKVD